MSWERGRSWRRRSEQAGSWGQAAVLRPRLVMPVSSASSAPLVGYVPTITVLRPPPLFPKADDFPGKFWKAALDSHIEYDSENIKSILRGAPSPNSPEEMEKNQQEAGCRLCPIPLHQLVTTANCLPSPGASLTIFPHPRCNAFLPCGRSARVAGLLQLVSCKTH